METEKDFDGAWWRFPSLRNGLIAGGLAGSGFLLAHLGGIPERIENIFYFLAIPIGAYHWTREGLEALFSEWEVGIDLLMLAATAGSAILGLWDEAAFLVFLYGSAEGLEEYTYARARSAIRGLLDLAPKEAHLVKHEREIVVSAEQLAPGDRFRVRPGQSIPTDGVIKIGLSSLDESSVTGESISVDKGPGMKVFAGTINRQGSLEVEATAAFTDNTLSKMIHLVEEAQEQKGKVQQWIERFGRRYSPAVLWAAFLMMFIPWMMGLPMDFWSRRAVVLLVAAAPCALIMSMPVAMAAGIGTAGKRGILIKGGVHLEHLGAIRVVVFDKTGTLTEGRPVVTDLIAFKGSKTEILSVAAGLEHHSEHPLGKAILEKAASEKVPLSKIEQFASLTGAGATGIIDGTTWYIGNPGLFDEKGMDLDAVSGPIDRLQKSGKTVALIGAEARLHGLIALQDRVKPEAAQSIDRLHQMRMKTAMLTGDNARTAKAIGKKMGIDDIRPGLKPEEKVAAVKAIEARYGPVLMVGDGVNDAAIEAADVALMADDLLKVEAALRLGRKVRRISQQNVVFSLIVLALLMLLALIGYLSVAAAVFFHEVSELLAVANGLGVARS